MPMFKVIKRRQFGGRVYEVGAEVNVGISYADIETPSYSQWREYFEPMVEPVKQVVNVPQQQHTAPQQ